ncbi:DoxX family protein [Aquamicrobium segne]|uniref:DoxX family protein n=1 Tax=Aquamicrobium segne TaxID=469547 RepID=A0ABW0GUB2_9HYPH
MQQLDQYQPQALAILRIMSSLLFIAHGTQKLFGFPGDGSIVNYMSLMGLAGILEVIGGICLVIGFKTRIVAFVLSGMMAVAYFMAHAPQNFFPVLNGGDAAILFCFVFLYLVFSGPGAWSLDSRS